MEAIRQAVMPAVYLDTSVPSAYLDARAPDRQRLTVRFWDERLPDVDGVISSLVLSEIADTPDPEKRAALTELVSGLRVLPFTDEADALAQEYIKRGVFTQNRFVDASHVAVAATNRIPYLVSWNFVHIVRVVVRREVNLVNALSGYDPVEIIAPPEL